MATATATKNNSKQAGKDLGDVSFTVEESRTVPDGAHTGIVDHTQMVERGEEGFRYFDVYVKDDASDVVIKVGYAASKVTPATELGQLLSRFGAPIIEGQQVRPVQVIAKGIAVAFDTVTEKNKNGRFARVEPETLRPVA